MRDFSRTGREYDAVDVFSVYMLSRISFTTHIWTNQHHFDWLICFGVGSFQRNLCPSSILVWCIWHNLEQIQIQSIVQRNKHNSASLRAYLCYSQVRDFKCAVCGQQQIPWFNVFVNDSLAVQIFKAIYKLAKVPGLGWGGGWRQDQTKVKMCFWQQAYWTIHYAAQTNLYDCEAYSSGHAPTRSLLSYCRPTVLNLNLGWRNDCMEAENKFSRRTKKHGEWRLTRELEILETFSLGRCPTFLASHKRNIPSPYTWVRSQGCLHKSNMYEIF